MAGCRMDRDLVRGRRAAALAHARGDTALQAACAHIEATFSPAMHHSHLKDRVAALIAGGRGNPEAWTRYRRLAERHPVMNLDTAIVLVERLRGAEYEARAAAIGNWGHSSRPRLALMILDELRLILRVTRRYAPVRYPEYIATLLGAGSLGAAVSVEAAE
jgi:hypothetical protein